MSWFTATCQRQIKAQRQAVAAGNADGAGVDGGDDGDDNDGSTRPMHQQGRTQGANVAKKNASGAAEREEKN